MEAGVIYYNSLKSKVLIFTKNFFDILRRCLIRSFFKEEFYEIRVNNYYGTYQKCEERRGEP